MIEEILIKIADQFNLVLNKSYFSKALFLEGVIDNQYVKIKTKSFQKKILIKAYCRIQILNNIYIYSKSLKFNYEFLTSSGINNYSLHDEPKYRVETGDKSFDADFTCQYLYPSDFKFIIKKKKRNFLVEILPIFSKFSNSFLKVDNYTFVALMNNLVRTNLKELNKDTSSLKINKSKFITAVNAKDINYEKLIKIIDHIIAVSKELSSHENLKNGLVQSLETDPLARFRFQCINKLILHHRDDYGVEKVLKKALKDENKYIQIVAAKSLGEKGVKHLSKMLVSYKSLPPKRIVGITRHLLEESQKVNLHALKYVFRKSQDDYVLHDVIKLFIKISYKSMIPFILKEFKEKSKKTQVNIIETIGSQGKLDDIESLKKLADDHPELKKIIAKAVVAIQIRHGIDPETGWLSLSDISDHDGLLSIDNPIEKGALSMGEKGEDGSLSIFDDETFEENP